MGSFSLNVRRVIFIAANLYVGAANADEPSYLCIGEQNVGFAAKKVDSKWIWQRTNFNLTKYIFRPINESDFKKWGMLLQYRDNGVLIREEYGVFHFGETMPVVGCHRWPTLPDVMTCNGIGGGSVNFAINLKALVFQIYYPGGYYLQSLSGDRFDTTSIEIGTCSPIS